MITNLNRDLCCKLPQLEQFLKKIVDFIILHQFNLFMNKTFKHKNTKTQQIHFDEQAVQATKL